MTTKIRQGLGLLVVAVLAFLLSVPTWGTEDPATAAGIWRMITGATAVVCGIVGLVLLATGLLKPDRDSQVR